MSEIENKLLEVQRKLKVPKSQYNSFGKYKYRSCEDILEAVKPVCNKLDILVTLSDEIVNIGPFNYVKATASAHYGEETMSSFGFAREAIEKKGMDTAQITGAASSYARKNALDGLFCIDDTKDSDAQQPEETKDEEPIELVYEVAGFKGSHEEILWAMKKKLANVKSKVNGEPLVEQVEKLEGDKTAKELVELLAKNYSEELK